MSDQHSARSGSRCASLARLMETQSATVLDAEHTCDFCGRNASRVQRVALDRDYDRLGVRHPVRYACEPCSQSKEAARTGVSHDSIASAG